MKRDRSSISKGIATNTILPFRRSKDSSNSVLPTDHLEPVFGWGMSTSAAGYVFRPSTLEGIREVLTLARRTNRSVGFRGAGRSYGDAAINAENIVLDLTRMNRILDWNPKTGLVKVEPGVTIKQLWESILPDGWWPAVVPGTMFSTIGGCVSMNIHGKNNFTLGPFGDHILEFELLTPEGEIFRCSRDENYDIFRSAIGGFGMLGCFTSIKLKSKRVWSGLLDVEAINVPSLDAMFDCFKERLESADYLVGWIDTFAGGKSLGRGVIHRANYIDQGIDPNPAQTLRVEHQQLPDTILGILPKAILWKFMKFFINNPGMRLINMIKFRASRLLDRGGTFRQSHAAFAFLLDYVPNWEKSYGKGGLIQYQSFVPKDEAREVFRKQLQLCKTYKYPPYLAVFKRHRPDEFLMSHALDGYSLALDFKITKRNRERIWKLAAEMNKIVLKASGRFYFAKDSTLSSEDARAFLGEKALEEFAVMKRRLDPSGMLETNLARRLFGTS
ncbi:MAG: FAD-binding oxidoreductase [Chlorobi bacterium]|nr:FAD-binding oxidoreductase [Chlorobiota bacterium]